MKAAQRLVVDTNVFVSAILFANSLPRQAVTKILGSGVLLLSEQTANELKEVLFRPKLDRYVSREERILFLAQLETVAERVAVIQIIRECRDPKDDTFLEVAVNGMADVIVTGDADLLGMSPWRGIEILSPSAYLDR